MNINTPEGMAAAVAWQTAWVDHIREGGTWVVPSTGTILQLHHSQKTVVEMARLFPEPLLRRVFEAMGWKYVEQQQAMLANLALS